jgi:hypothetical protein
LAVSGALLGSLEGGHQVNIGSARNQGRHGPGASTWERLHGSLRVVNHGTSGRRVRQIHARGVTAEAEDPILLAFFSIEVDILGLCRPQQFRQDPLPLASAQPESKNLIPCRMCALSITPSPYIQAAGCPLPNSYRHPSKSAPPPDARWPTHH